MLPQRNDLSKSNSKAIYINPNFRRQLPITESVVNLNSESVIPKNTHINPLFLEAHKYRPAIHMNPAFLQNLQQCQQHRQNNQNQEKEANVKNIPENVSRNLQQYPNDKSMTNSSNGNCKTTETRKVICKSKNRLIREPLIKNMSQSFTLSKSIRLPPLLVLNKRKLIRKVSSLPKAFNTLSTQKNCDDFRTIISRYKLDNRVIKKKPLLPPTPKIKRTCFVGRYALRRTSLSLSTNRRTNNKVVNKKLQLLNINGLLYKSTRNSLKLKDVSVHTDLTLKSSENKLSNLKDAINTSTLKTNQGLTIFVRGTKYVMDVNKFKLTRVSNDDHSRIDKVTKNLSTITPTFRRIDIGGYTYISVNSAKNVLVRTTNHLSRAYVHNAKQKSVQMLTKNLVKTNVPCPIFQRVGKCAAFERGKCSKVHNKLQVAICSKFLRGECVNSKCLLSHNVSLSKMPVCKFFLQGVCVRNDCPYLHKKLSNQTELCNDFLRGFCQMADKCNKRHEFVCPEVERNSICMTTNCIYCNAKKRKDLQIEKKSDTPQIKNTSSTLASHTQFPDVSETCKRYFVDPCGDDTNESLICKEELFTNDDTCSNTDIAEITQENGENGRSRPKIGNLPAYIPL